MSLFLGKTRSMFLRLFSFAPLIFIKSISFTPFAYIIILRGAKINFNEDVWQWKRLPFYCGSLVSCLNVFLFYEIKRKDGVRLYRNLDFAAFNL